MLKELFSIKVPTILQFTTGLSVKIINNPNRICQTEPPFAIGLRIFNIFVTASERIFYLIDTIFNVYYVSVFIQ